MKRDLVKTAKRIVKTILGRDFFPVIDCNCRMERFGSEYGGWDVDVQSIGCNSVVYSFGVGEDASFDLALIERFGLTVHAFDPTPKSIEWVRREPMPANFIFHEYGLADFDGNVSFSPPENPDHVSHTILQRPATVEKAINVPVKRLYTIIKELGHDRIDILKMDIEGAEYGAISDLIDCGIRPRQVLVEFHHRFKDVGVTESKEAIRKLRGHGYCLFSVSNSGEEFCFKVTTT